MTELIEKLDAGDIDGVLSALLGMSEDRREEFLGWVLDNRDLKTYFKMMKKVVHPCVFTMLTLCCKD